MGRFIFAFQVLQYPVLDGFDISSLQRHGLELFDPQPYLLDSSVECQLGQPLPPIPIAIGSTTEWKKANALASALYAPQEHEIPNDVTAESVWWVEVQMRRMLQAVHHRMDLKQSRCGGTPRCDHWSLRAGSYEQHACPATLSIDRDNVAYANLVTLESEAPAGSRRAKAKVQASAEKPARRSIKHSGLPSVRQLAHLPRSARIRLWTSHIRDNDALHSEAVAGLFGKWPVANQHKPRLIMLGHRCAA